MVCTNIVPEFEWGRVQSEGIESNRRLQINEPIARCARRANRSIGLQCSKRLWQL